MPYNPEIHHRRSIRLKNYDYTSQGAYFITIVTQNREHFFGEIINGSMHLNECGKIAQHCWLDIPNHFPNTQLDEFVIMPNHVHGIIYINDNDFIGEYDVGANDVGVYDVGGNDVGVYDVGANNNSPLPKRPRGTSKTIGSIVRGFKIGVTKWFRQHTNIYNVWQRNYYKRIIRNDFELKNIRQYIINNPSNWQQNHENFK